MSFITDAINELNSSIADSAMNGLVSWVSSQYETGVNDLSEDFFNKFHPDMQNFFSFTGTTWADEIYKVFTIGGFTLAVVITIYMLTMILAGIIKLADAKDTWGQLLGGLLVSIFCIFNAEKITNLMFYIADVFWDVMNISTSGSTVTTLIASVFYPVGIASVLVSGSALVLIVGMILGIIFLVQILKFMLEVTERYIVACLLGIAFPLAAGTIPSKVTRSIFHKYFQMFVCQLILLLFNGFFIKGIIYMAANNDNTFTQWIFMFAYVKAAQKVDSWLHNMGLSAAITGGNLWDSIGASFFALSRMGKMAMSGAGNVMGAAGGAALKSGIASGNVGKVQSGAKLLNAAHPIKAAMSGNNVTGSTEGALSFASKSGRGAELASKLKPSDIDSSVVSMVRSGRNPDLLNAMNDTTKKATLQKAYGDLIPSSASTSGIKFNKDGSVSGKLNFKDASGISHDKGFSIGNDIMKNGIAVSANTDANGQDNILSVGKGMNYGENIAVDSNDLETSSILTGCDLGQIEDSKLLDDISSAIGDEDGSVLFKDDDGNNLMRGTDNGFIYGTPTLDSESLLDFNPCGDDDDAVAFGDGDASHSSLFAGVEDIKLTKNDRDGMVCVTGYRRGMEAKREPVSYSMVNMARYTKDTVPASLSNNKYVGTYGNYNDEQNGLWRVYDTTAREYKPVPRFPAHPDINGYKNGANDPEYRKDVQTYWNKCKDINTQAVKDNSAIQNQFVFESNHDKDGATTLQIGNYDNKSPIFKPASCSEAYHNSELEPNFYLNYKDAPFIKELQTETPEIDFDWDSDRKKNTGV